MIQITQLVTLYSLTKTHLDMFKCSVCFEKLSDTNIVWIGACGHFCCAKCSAVVEKVYDKYTKYSY